MVVLKVLPPPVVAGGKKIVICSDSESMIKALISHVMTYKLVKECRETLNLNDLRNQIMLVW